MVVFFSFSFSFILFYFNTKLYKFSQSENRDEVKYASKHIHNHALVNHPSQTSEPISGNGGNFLFLLGIQFSFSTAKTTILYSVFHFSSFPLVNERT